MGVILVMSASMQTFMLFVVLSTTGLSLQACPNFCVLSTGVCFVGWWRRKSHVNTDENGPSSLVEFSGIEQALAWWDMLMERCDKLEFNCPEDNCTEVQGCSPRPPYGMRYFCAHLAGLFQNLGRNQVWALEGRLCIFLLVVMVSELLSLVSLF